MLDRSSLSKQDNFADTVHSYLQAKKRIWAQFDLNPFYLLNDRPFVVKEIPVNLITCKRCGRQFEHFSRFRDTITKQYCDECITARTKTPVLKKLKICKCGKMFIDVNGKQRSCSISCGAKNRTKYNKSGVIAYPHKQKAND